MPEQTQSKTIEDKNLIESVLFLKAKNLLSESKSTIKFETIKEAETEKKEEIVNVIREQINIIKQNITELQKVGYNLHLESIKLIEVPLKTKIWTSTLAKKDLENIFKIFQEVETIITPLKSENDARVTEKERLEKEADKKEKTQTV